MIFSCPSCGASHFKPDAEVESGTDVVCRRCRYEFHVNLEGVVDSGAGSESDESAAQPEPAAGDSLFEDNKTAIMKPGDLSPGPDDEPTVAASALTMDEATRADEQPEAIPASDGFGETHTDVAPGLAARFEAGDFDGKTEAFTFEETAASSADELSFPSEIPAEMDSQADDFLSGETQAVVPPTDGLVDLESFPGASDPRDGDELDNDGFPDEPPVPEGIAPELLEARDQARGGTVADDELADSLAHPGGDERDFDDDLTGVQQALPPVPKRPATGASAGALLSAGGTALKELGAVVGRQPLPLKV
ncbi:MAG: hypothetical protein AAFQ82_01185, partial [Myxococcota bacterium]